MLCAWAYELLIKYVTISAFYFHGIMKVKVYLIGTLSLQFESTIKQLHIYCKTTKDMTNIYTDYRRYSFL